jgi:hypothetical protein
VFQLNISKNQLNTIFQLNQVTQYLAEIFDLADFG